MPLCPSGVYVIGAYNKDVENYAHSMVLNTTKHLPF